MNIALYIVTYQGHKRINVTLESIFDTMSEDVTVNVINNHTDLRMKSAYYKKVIVHHNSLRPDWSSGHLSRNWNQALLLGFKDLSKPINDIVVCSQDDSIFKPNWTENLIEQHERFDFIQNGHGDQFHSYVPNAVKKVGMWDERFCGLSRQGADYMWRCVMHNKDRSSIQDPKHKRVLNPLFPNVNKSQNYFVDADVRQIDQAWDNNPYKNNQISQKLIHYKYGYDPYPWTEEKIKNASPEFKGMNFVTYPYFEKDVELAGKNYLI